MATDVETMVSLLLENDTVHQKGGSILNVFVSIRVLDNFESFSFHHLHNWLGLGNALCTCSFLFPLIYLEAPLNSWKPKHPSFHCVTLNEVDLPINRFIVDIRRVVC